MQAAIRLGLAVAAVTVLAAGCGSESQTARVDLLPSASPAPQNSGPVVEVVPVPTRPPLDPNADPGTPLGELRARYLPIWSSDFDWAFPPELCGSDWALDAIAEPASGADLAVLGDPAAAAALSVMRYEYLLSRAYSEPHVLAQLCIAVATAGPARSEALDLLVTYLGTGGGDANLARYPDEVTIVAASPTAALAVACLTAKHPEAVHADGEIAEDEPAPVVLRAYLVEVSRGLEDAVTDISYRVSNVAAQPASGCDELDSWTLEWEQQATDWASEGAVWGPVGRTVTAGGLCRSRSADRSGDCPQDWAQ